MKHSLNSLTSIIIITIVVTITTYWCTSRSKANVVLPSDIGTKATTSIDPQPSPSLEVKVQTTFTPCSSERQRLMGSFHQPAPPPGSSGGRGGKCSAGTYLLLVPIPHPHVRNSRTRSFKNIARRQETRRDGHVIPGKLRLLPLLRESSSIFAPQRYTGSYFRWSCNVARTGCHSSVNCVIKFSERICSLDAGCRAGWFRSVIVGNQEGNGIVHSRKTFERKRYYFQ